MIMFIRIYIHMIILIYIYIIYIYIYILFIYIYYLYDNIDYKLHTNISTISSSIKQSGGFHHTIADNVVDR